MTTMTVKQAAAYFGVSARTIMRWLKNGKLASMKGKSGKLILFVEDASGADGCHAGACDSADAINCANSDCDIDPRRYASPGGKEPLIIDQPDALISQEIAARILGYGIDYIRCWVDSRYLDCVETEHGHMFTPEHLADWIRNH